VKPLSTPAEKKKAVGLVVGCVLVFGFLAKSMMGLQSGTPPPPETVNIGGKGAEVSASNPGAPVVAIGGGTQPAAEKAPDQIDPPTFLPGDTPNPFHTASGAEVGDPNAPRIVQPIVVATHQQQTSKTKRIRPMDGGIGNEPILPDNRTKPPDVNIQPSTDAMYVKGVMPGNNPVAVIQVGSQEFVVSKGERFGRGMNLRLRDVSESQVVIEQGSELHIIRVGSHPPSPSQAPASNSTQFPSTSKSSGIS